MMMVMMVITSAIAVMVMMTMMVEKLNALQALLLNSLRARHIIRLQKHRRVCTGSSSSE